MEDWEVLFASAAGLYLATRSGGGKDSGGNDAVVAGTAGTDRGSNVKGYGFYAQYNVLIEKYCGEADVDLIRGIIQTESSFNPKAEPNPGEGPSYGLMQVIPSSAKLFGFQGTPQDLFEPEICIKYGCAILLENYSRLHSWEDSVAAYNMGKVKRRTDGSYVNQTYVDRVFAYADSFRKVGQP